MDVVNLHIHNPTGDLSSIRLFRGPGGFPNCPPPPPPGVDGNGGCMPSDSMDTDDEGSTGGCEPEAAARVAADSTHSVPVLPVEGNTKTKTKKVKKDKDKKSKSSSSKSKKEKKTGTLSSPVDAGHVIVSDDVHGAASSLPK